MSRGRTQIAGALAAVLLAVAVSGCASSRTFRRGEAFAQAGDWDSAVAYYTRAVQADPDRPDYKIALERAMLAASQMYAARAKEFEAANQPEEALRAYRKALEFEPSNRPIALRAAEIERMLRDRLEATAPRPEIEKLREQARRQTGEPILNPASRDPLRVLGEHPRTGTEIKLMDGRYGAYVTDGTTNATLPKTADKDTLTLEEAAQLIDERAAKGPAKGKKKTASKKAPPKKAAAKKAKSV